MRPDRTASTKITQRDIAKQTGVSPTAVSLVLNNPDTTKVGPAKKAEILALASALPPRRTRNSKGSVTVLVTNLSDVQDYLARIVDGIHEAAGRSGWRMSVEVDPDKVLELIQGGETNALILTRTMDETFYEAVPSIVPLVQVPGRLSDKFDSLTPDEREGVRRTVVEANRSGHHHIAFLGLEKTLPEYEHERERVGGYSDGLRQCGLPVNPDYIAVTATNFANAGNPTKAIHRWAQSSKPPTLLITYNDVAASHALYTAMATGIRVPEQLSIIGFDNSSLCQIAQPELASIDCDFKEMGQQAFTQVLNNYQSRRARPPLVTYIRCEFVPRASFACRPSKDALAEAS